MAQIKCNVCNNEYDENEASCPSCGNKIIKKTSSKNNLPLYIGIGLVGIIIIIIVVVLIIGSGNDNIFDGNSITCTQTRGKSTDIIKMELDGKRISKATRTQEVMTSNEDEANEFYEGAKTVAKNENNKGKYTYSKDGLKVTLSGTASYEDLNELHLDHLADFESKEALIKNFEEKGYTCKK